MQIYKSIYNIYNIIYTYMIYDNYILYVMLKFKRADRVVLKHNQTKNQIFKFEWCTRTLFEFV